MAKDIEDKVEYYYDSHSTQEDLMGESSSHSQLVHYLVSVLRQLFHGQVCCIYRNLNFYQTSNLREYPLDPDLAVIKGVELQVVSSWKVGKTGPAPQVVIEIAQEQTWDTCLEEMPLQYARMGVEEYFAYDPHTPLIGRDATRRLFGWQLDKATRLMRAMPLDADGRLWSAHLESFLVPDGAYLRLYERERTGHLCLTGEEAATRRADAATRRADALAEKLRSLGIDPDQL